MDAVSCDKKFLFSVIIPIYNGERYLEEALESIIEQSIGFRKNIQVILVDNASSDKSSEICNQYLQLFPDNIIYIRNERNEGIAGGCNIGIQYATGKYVNFMDCDDRWSDKAFKIAYDFLEANENDIDCVACRIKQFESNGRFLYLDYKFQGDKVIDIKENYMDVQLSVVSVFIKNNIARGTKFCEALRGEEDNRYITEIILNKGKYGIISSAIYYYRKRRDKSNALEDNYLTTEYYSSNILHGINYLMDYSVKKYGIIIPYVQFTVMCMLGLRFKNNKCESMPEDLVDEYKQQIIKVLKQIDDYVILEQKIIFSEYKIFALRLKYGEEFRQRLYFDGRFICINGEKIFSLRKKSILDLYVLEIVDGNLKLHGNAGIPFEEFEYEIYFTDSKGNKYVAANTPAYKSEKKSLGEVILCKKGFDITIPLGENKLEIKAFIIINGTKYKLNIRFKDWAKLSNDLSASYYYNSGYIIKKRDNGLLVTKNNKSFRSEIKLWCELFQQRKFKIIFKRAFLKLAKKIKGKHQIWLFVDRVDMANENAEFLYKYINGKKEKYIHCFYVLGRGSQDYERVKGYGKVLNFNGWLFRMMYFLADYYITSQTTRFILKPPKVPKFWGSYQFYKDCYPPFVYLQHGVTEKDLSFSQKKIAHNLRLFITSAYTEYQSILKYPYGYSEREVKMSGLARYDSICLQCDDKRNKIVIAPTWRQNLSTNIDTVNGRRGYNSQFKKSDFYQFYNTLINDERILREMRKKGYEGVFRPHPCLYEQSVDFITNDVFKIEAKGEGYSEQFKKSCLLITDYSSIATDYAYANCPVIYAQFDKDVFYQGHTYEKGFFDYEKDGFGPVCYDYESTVKSILNAIKNDCQLQEIYKKRKREFFAHFDGKNCERTYQEILNLGEEK